MTQTPIAAVPATAEQRAAFERGLAHDSSPLPGFPVADIWGGYTAPRYLVKRLLGPDEITVLFGQSGHFKSVFAIDLALCVGTGQPFHGTKARKAGVLYIAGEGFGGIRKRVRAWMLTHGLDAAAEQPAVYVTSAGADLTANPQQVRATVASAAEVLGLPIELVIVDTLAANFGAGEESSATDMSLALTNVRQATPGASVLLIHHTGHGEQNRERGSYALIASADYRLQATYDEIAKQIELRWHKAKDDERPEPMIFEWRQVPLEWTDEDGEELSSVVVERITGATFQPGPRAVGLGKNQEIAMRALNGLYTRVRRNLKEQDRDPAEALILVGGWRAECEKKGINRGRWPEAMKGLQDRGLITIDGPHVVIVEGMK